MWRCDVCDKPITAKSRTSRGMLLFADPETKRYPRWSEQDERKAQAEYGRQMNAFNAEHTSEGGLVVHTMGDLDNLPEFPARCLMRAVHLKCDPNPDGSEYWLAAEDHTGDELLNIVAHLLGKHWFGAEEARRLIYKYLAGRR